MEIWLQTTITMVCSVLASSGLWSWMTYKSNKKDAKTEMLIGLGHDRVSYLGLLYLNRGWISSDEYENLYEYLYKPYEKLGGNGSAKRIMEQVSKLPIQKSNYK